MKFLNLTILLFSVFSFSGCATRQQTVNKKLSKTSESTYTTVKKTENDFQ